MAYSLKQKLGALAIDWPRYELAIRSSWVDIRNRNERLRRSPDGRGVECLWQWTSDLHLTSVYPALGRRLMARAISQWPIAFADAPNRQDGDIQVSVIIGHRGMQRLPQLQATLATIAAQDGVNCECVVVEQASRSEVRDLLPSWVRYVFTPVPDTRMPYNRSWALNVGARLAKGRVLVFHDNDMLVPQAYAAELWNRYQCGYEAINLKRFIMYLTAGHSADIVSTRTVMPTQAPETIVQNLEAGGSVAMGSEAFFAIGGYDEAFVGWGGEDNEFWERAQTRRTWPWTCLPIVHLWHAPQPEKLNARPPATEYLRTRSTLPAERRIAELAARAYGSVDRPDPPWPDPGRGP